MFSDMLGSSLGVVESGKLSEIRRTSFGESFSSDSSGSSDSSDLNFFTGKPAVEGLGYSFLFRNYRADVGKWMSSDPLGYPDGWNNLAYVNNWVTGAIDRFGTDIWHIVDTEGAGGFGHSAAIIGNDNDGYDFYSYGPTVDRPSTENVPVTHLSARTYNELVMKLQSERILDGLSPYDKWEKWNTDSATDALAREGIMEFDGTDYDFTQHNCWLAVRNALEGAQVRLPIALTTGPNENFARNINQGLVDAYNWNDTTLSIPE